MYLIPSVKNLSSEVAVTGETTVRKIKSVCKIIPRVYLINSNICKIFYHMLSDNSMSVKRDLSSSPEEDVEVILESDSVSGQNRTGQEKTDKARQERLSLIHI